MSDFEMLCFLSICFVGGVLAVHKTGVDLGVIDHGSIVWDEIVPFWLVLLFCPALVVADHGLLPVPLFRHRQTATGALLRREGEEWFGVMTDDLMCAAGYTCWCWRSCASSRMSACDQASLEGLAAEVGEQLAGQRRAPGDGRILHRWLGRAVPDGDRRQLALVRARLHHLLERSQDRDAWRRAEHPCAQGAVSERPAAAMALGALAHSHADWALAITGVAGPAGGSPTRPSGPSASPGPDRKGSSIPRLVVLPATARPCARSRWRMR
jgi:hypothetical protein